MSAPCEFVWVEEGDRLLGGQWMRPGGDGAAPVVLADAVAAHRKEPIGDDPIAVHVAATLAVVEAAGTLEDELLPTSVDRLDRSLAAGDTGEPEIDPDTLEGERVRHAADALEKLAADLAELVHEQLDEGGSLATLPPDSTRALCLAVQTAWRLRTRIEPPGPLYL
jgi:hypothetical protein